MANLPTYGRNEAAVTAREAQVALADFDDGMNLVASNAPGIGISTGIVHGPYPRTWTELDQHVAARDPQGIQHIGGIGIEDGNEGVYYPVQAIQGIQVPDGTGGTDNTDTLSYIEALAQAAPGVGFGALNADPINRTDVTIEIGDHAWGTNTVA